MISIALPVFPGDALAVIPAAAPDTGQTESQGVSFAELLMELDAGPEKTTEASVAPAEMQKTVKSTSVEEPDIPEPPSPKVDDDPADVVALAYAFVSAIPMPEPTPTPIAAPARTSIDPSVTSPVSVPSQSKPWIGPNIAEILPNEDAVGVVTQPELTTVTAKPRVAAPLGSQTPAPTPNSAEFERGAQPLNPNAIVKAQADEEHEPQQPQHGKVEPEEAVSQVAEPAVPRADAVIPQAHTWQFQPITSTDGNRDRKVEDVGSITTPFRDAAPTPALNEVSPSKNVAPDPIRMAPVVLEARITPKVEAKAVADPAIRTPEVSPSDPVSKSRTVEPVSDTEFAEFSSEHDEAGEKSHADATPQQRLHTPQIPFDAPATPEVQAPRTSNPRPIVQEPMRPSYVVRDERPEATAQPAPLKQVDIRIPDAQGGVTVRVHERAGAVHVSVRSADAQIAGNIAETLPDLTRQLDHQGFHSETWTPSKESVFQAEQMMRAHDLSSASANADTAHANQPADSAHTHNETDDDRRRPDWEEPTPKRPRTPRSEDFKEYL